jgi:hypothetical protein
MTKKGSVYLFTVAIQPCLKGKLRPSNTGRQSVPKHELGLPQTLKCIFQEGEKIKIPLSIKSTFVKTPTVLKPSESACLDICKASEVAISTGE